MEQSGAADIFYEAMTDLKFVFLMSLIAGYVAFKFTKRGKSKDDPRDDVSTVSYNEDGDGDDSKMVLVVRNDLKMGKGKVAAQCAHGAVAAYKAALKHPKLLRAWENEGQKKITLKVDSDTALKELAKHARSVGLLTNIVQDAGRTQIAAGSRTVCAIGPGPSKLIDDVTGHLKLF